MNVPVSVNIFTDNGLFAGDIALIVIAFIAAVLSMWRMTGTPNTLRLAGTWFISIGWLLVLAHFAIHVALGLDPPVSTAGQISLSVLGAGTILYILGDHN